MIQIAIYAYPMFCLDARVIFFVFFFFFNVVLYILV